MAVSAISSRSLHRGRYLSHRRDRGGWTAGHGRRDGHAPDGQQLLRKHSSRQRSTSLSLSADRRIFPLVPDPPGWVDRTETGSTNIQGRWYGFADGFGADGTSASGVCELAGHAPADCSQLASPSPGNFPNLGGKMCTMGVAAQVANIVGGTTPDYNAISSAGIAFSFNVPEVTATTQLPYDAIANGVAGFGFDIDTVPSSGVAHSVSDRGTVGESPVLGRLGNDIPGGPRPQRGAVEGRARTVLRRPRRRPSIPRWFCGSNSWCPTASLRPRHSRSA